MKILLVNPPTYDLYSEVGADMPPLGLAYIAAVLKNDNFDVEIVDKNVETGPIDYPNYSIVGISSLTPTYPVALKIAEEAKKSGATTVMGGYHATFLDEEVLNTGLIDYVVRGEGEYVFRDLVRHIAQKKPVEEVKGISYRSKGRIVRTPDALPPDPIDDLPFPARELLKLDRYHTHLNEMPMTTMITSRGCPFNCFFCASSLFGGRKWRARSPKSVVDEIEQLKYDYGYKAVDFMDDNFTLSPERTIGICEEMIRRKLNVSWWALSRADTIVRNEDMVKKMAEAGAYMLFIGMESPDPTVLKFYHKREGKEVFTKAVKLLKKYGIRVWASFMMGAVSETKKMIDKTIYFARKLNIDAAQFSILTPYPGTALYHYVKDRIFVKDWSLFDGMHSVFKTDYLTPKDLGYLTFKAYTLFYLKPVWFTKEIFRAIKNRRLFWTLRNYPWKLLKLTRRFLSSTYSSNTLK